MEKDKRPDYYPSSHFKLYYIISIIIIIIIIIQTWFQDKERLKEHEFFRVEKLSHTYPIIANCLCVL
jgi:hypothetical protein